MEKFNNIIQFNNVISNAFPEYEYYPSILNTSKINSGWDMTLPDVQDKDGIVLHTQDNLNVAYNNIVPEIVTIEDFYQQSNIGEIVVIHWNHRLKDIYDGVLKLIEFPTHSFDFIQHFVNRQSEWSHVSKKSNTLNFMCLNGRPRKHRVMVYKYLKSLNMNAVITINGDGIIDQNMSYNNYDFNNVDNFIKLLNLYQQTPVNIITETLYYESRGILTEKLLQAFASLQLPIIIGHKGAVADARRYGFDMFDDIIDNSFDEMDNDIRWSCALDLNMHILNNAFDYSSLLPRLVKNQQYLLNTYPRLLVDNFHKQVKAI